MFEVCTNFHFNLFFKCINDQCVVMKIFILLVKNYLSIFAEYFYPENHHLQYLF